MSVTLEQIQAVDQEFFASTPEAQAYRTDENLGKIYAYLQAAFPEAALTVAARQIAFKDLLAKRQLKKIAGWVAPVTEAQRQLVDGTPSYLASEKYKTDPDFRAAFDAIAREEKERQELLNWARTYQTMDPTEAAQRLLDEPGFKEAVQTLIDEGLI
jgi:hypothetical protein